MASNRDDTPNMAVFCDFENVALGVRDANYNQFDIGRVLERLLLKGSIVVKKAYCDWERYREFKAAMHQASFELIEIPHVRQSGKNSADIRMVVDALDLCYTKSHVDTFVIISGDSDFSPLVSKLRENAKTVIGVGVKNSTSDLLIANCDEFIYYDDLVRGQPRTRARAGARGDAQKTSKGGGEGAKAEAGSKTKASSKADAGSKGEVAAKTEVAPRGEAPKPETAKLETPKAEVSKSEAAKVEAAKVETAKVEPAAPAVAKTKSPKADPAASKAERPANGHGQDAGGRDEPVPPGHAQEAIDLVVDTIEALADERDDTEKIWGSMVKQTLRRQRPGFNEAYYGYRSFNSLLEDARDRGLIELERDEKSGGYTVRSLA